MGSMMQKKTKWISTIKHVVRLQQWTVQMQDQQTSGSTVTNKKNVLNHRTFLLYIINFTQSLAFLIKIWYNNLWLCCDSFFAQMVVLINNSHRVINDLTLMAFLNMLLIRNTSLDFMGMQRINHLMLIRKVLIIKVLLLYLRKGVVLLWIASIYKMILKNMIMK